MDKAELMVSVSGIADVANACEWAGHDNEARVLSNRKALLLAMDEAERKLEAD